ncbi:hypothetical protein HBH53_041200 [Parastagonospora nodorum]|nr:hypothetical protein HBH53_041200 [Parastagonospora nodorum]
MVGDTSFLDYENMIKRAESIARALRSNGCAKGSVVATYQERNPDWICSVLGIWHAGAICLPLDIGLPASRLVAIVHHCEPRFVLRQGETIDNMVQEAFNASGARIASMSELTYCKNAGKVIEPDFSGLGDVYAKDPAMILYTSGSTGTPKGIILQHEGLRNWIEAVMQLFEFEIGRDEVILQQASPSFDMCFAQMLVGICSGGLLCLVAREFSADAKFLTKAIANERITFTSATPSEYLNWLHYGDRKALSQSLPH